MNIKKLFPLIMCVPMFQLTACGEPNLDGFILKKKNDEPYKILQLTDIQLIDPNQQPYKDRLSPTDLAHHWEDKDLHAYNLVKRLVNETKPDYIVITGDNVYGQFDGDGSNFISFITFMDSFKIPWSYVNGNHDGEYVINDPSGNQVTCGKGYQWQADYVKKNAKYCLYEQGSAYMGYGNYMVHLLDKNNKQLFNFTFLDSHGCLGYASPSINYDQREWYEQQINKANEVAKAKVPNFCFFHMPLTQFHRAALALGSDEQGKIEITTDGSVDANGNFGANYEQAASFSGNEFWNLVKSLGCTKGIFVGHDHINNSSIMYEGVRLTFGTKTGTYDYHKVEQQGGTLITINNDQSFDVKPILIK